MKPKNRKDYRVSVRLPPYIYDELSDISLRHKVFMSVIIRAFLERVINSINGSKDLGGSYDSPKK